jgi:hypothetical protein
MFISTYRIINDPLNLNIFTRNTAREKNYILVLVCVPFEFLFNSNKKRDPHDT